MKQRLKSGETRLCKPETCCFARTGAVHINMSSVEAFALAVDVLVLGTGVSLVTLLVLDRPSECSTQIRQAVRQVFVECQGERAMRLPWWQDRARCESTKLVIRLRSGEEARVVA